MRFGLFVPQGWRLDLVGIDPAEQWEVMRDLATMRRRRPLGVAVGLRPLPHRADADRRGHATRPGSLMAALAATTRGSGSARCAPA